VTEKHDFAVTRMEPHLKEKIEFIAKRWSGSAAAAGLQCSEGGAI
jgi:hypothetical protein